MFDVKWLVETCLDFGDIPTLTVVAHEGGVGEVVGVDPTSLHLPQQLMGSCQVPSLAISIQQAGIGHYAWSNATVSHLPQHFCSPATLLNQWSLLKSCHAQLQEGCSQQVACKL